MCTWASVLLLSTVIFESFFVYLSTGQSATSCVKNQMLCVILYILCLLNEIYNSKQRKQSTTCTLFEVCRCSANAIYTTGIARAVIFQKNPSCPSMRLVFVNSSRRIYTVDMHHTYTRQLALSSVSSHILCTYKQSKLCKVIVWCWWWRYCGH